MRADKGIVCMCVCVCVCVCRTGDGWCVCVHVRDVRVCVLGVRGVCVSMQTRGCVCECADKGMYACVCVCK